MARSATSSLLFDGRRILFVVPPSRFDEGEFYQTWQLLAEEGAWLVVASCSATGVAAGESGASVRTRRLERLAMRDYDALVLVEGAAEPAEELARSGRLVATAVAAGRTVGAFGRLGAELSAAGLPVVQCARGGLARFVAELAVRIARQPRLPLPPAPAPVR